MSEKMQHTAASLREKMTTRYGDGLIHKHNKLHHPYRQHCRTHPVIPANGHDQGDMLFSNGSTGLIREFKLKKMRKRLDKGRIH